MPRFFYYYILDTLVILLWNSAAAAAKLLQSCPTLCDPIDGSPPGSTVPGILQARTLEWIAISFSNAWKWKVKVKSLSRVLLFAIPWTAAYQAPPSMGFFRQEYWSGLPLPSPWNPGSCLFLLFLIFYFVFEYSQLTILWLFQVNSKGTEPHIHIFPYSPKLHSHPSCHITLSRVPYAMQ